MSIIVPVATILAIIAATAKRATTVWTEKKLMKRMHTEKYIIVKNEIKIKNR
jgi:hypothetical protein